MPWLQCPQEQDYQHRLSVILSCLCDHYDSKSDTEPFPPPGHNPPALIAWQAPLDGFYLTGEHERWGDDISHEARIQSCHVVFFGWDNQEFQDLLRPKLQGLYLPVPQEERMFDFSRYLCVLTPLIAAYYSGLMLAKGRLPSITRTVLQREWAVLPLFAFLYAAHDGLIMQLMFSDWRLRQDADLDAPVEQLFGLPCELFRFIQGLRVQNIVPGTALCAAKADSLQTSEQFRGVLFDTLSCAVANPFTL
ncbi:hypothetical protein BWQ96_09584 [Gracilariopsis chorda]|uniref:Uncharacterized protein n=1 Tax=Gracilariopsis chorda TaxID=448386 RepID=A0A2V3IF44_9FLOR|nr:hypothetical protein BWQ96_09584 [Gracilariopsis chorda]|eukprot:PXF40706.1 hypothetical protein BWQ96_09584 [Gracilariopsis chorda]